MVFWNPGQLAGGFFTPPNVPILDQVTSATAAYSTRLLKSTYAGSAIRVRRSSDNAEADIGFLSGELDQAALLAHVGAGSGYIVTWYDQSGSGYNATQSTAANQPRIVNAGTIDTLNGKPSIVFDGLTNLLSLSGTGLGLVNNLPGATLHAVTNPTTAASTLRMFYASVNASNAIRLNADVFTSNRFFIGSRRLDADTASSLGSSNNAYTSSVANVASFFWDFVNTTVQIRSNGTNVLNNATWQTTGNSQNTNSLKINIGAGDAAVYWNSNISEMIFYPTALSTANRQIVERNQGVYFSVTVA